MQILSIVSCREPLAIRTAHCVHLVLWRLPQIEVLPNAVRNYPTPVRAAYDVALGVCSCGQCDHFAIASITTLGLLRGAQERGLAAF